MTIEMTTFYRARLTLEEVEPYTDSNGFRREHTAEISAHTVTGNTPADAMVQMCAHTESLYDWHLEQADDTDASEPVTVKLSTGIDFGAQVRKVVDGMFHYCAICGKRGPIRHEGSSYICAGCNAILDAQKQRAEEGVSGRQDDTDEPAKTDPASCFCGRCNGLIEAYNDGGWKHVTGARDHLAAPAEAIAAAAAEAEEAHVQFETGSIPRRPGYSHNAA